jgi:ubiquitin C-terminal hydrolase
MNTTKDDQGGQSILSLSFGSFKIDELKDFQPAVVLPVKRPPNNNKPSTAPKPHGVNLSTNNANALTCTQNINGLALPLTSKKNETQNVLHPPSSPVAPPPPSHHSTPPLEAAAIQPRPIKDEQYISTPVPKSWAFVVGASPKTPRPIEVKPPPSEIGPSASCVTSPRSVVSLIVNNGANTQLTSRQTDHKSPPSAPAPILDLLRDFPTVPPLVLQPRGLVNPTNTCFMNVVLQSLMNCHIFVYLLSKLNAMDLPKEQYHVLSKFLQLFHEFKTPPALLSQSKGSPAAKQKHANLLLAKPLLPDFFFDLFTAFGKRAGTVVKDGEHVRQQDAQEFLCFLLDSMHEELLSMDNEIPEKEERKSAEIHGEDKSAESDGWEEVGRKNTTSIILTKDTYSPSPISHIFGGKLRSSVRKQGDKASVTIQPFYCLPLDIEPPQVKTLEDALTLFMSPEMLEGYTCSKRNVEIHASKQTTLEQLPKVLILVLKRFTYDSSQAHKLDKHVSFPSHLAIRSSFLSHDRVATDAQRQYKLFAVASHHGKVPAKGHYTCDININDHWFHFDDTSVISVPPQTVQSRKAYILFYKQLDPITSQKEDECKKIKIQ